VLVRRSRERGERGVTSQHLVNSHGERQRRRGFARLSGRALAAGLMGLVVTAKTASAEGTAVGTGADMAPRTEATTGAIAGVVPGAPNFAIHVSGNDLVNNEGQAVRLVGVDRSGTEYACAEGWGIFDGPSDATSVSAMASWGVNAVRVPLNEDCWLGINGVSGRWGGERYQRAIEQYVSVLGEDHIVAILDLHWSAPGGTLALGQQNMADADHSVTFWRSVASAFRADPAVMFDLYNEPHDISWQCWLDGCVVPASSTGPAWRAAGMQALVDAVRATGATQPIVLEGVDWAGDVSRWLPDLPWDPLHQEVASIHVYSFSGCSQASCWNANYAPLAKTIPVIAGEVGQNGCSGGFADGFLDWADIHNISYLAWTWDVWGCPYSLVSNYDGEPTPWGAIYQAHISTLRLTPLVGYPSGSITLPRLATLDGLPGPAQLGAPS